MPRNWTPKQRKKFFALLAKRLFVSQRELKGLKRFHYVSKLSASEREIPLGAAGAYRPFGHVLLDADDYVFPRISVLRESRWRPPFRVPGLRDWAPRKDVARHEIAHHVFDKLTPRQQAKVLSKFGYKPPKYFEVMFGERMMPQSPARVAEERFADAYAVFRNRARQRKAYPRHATTGYEHPSLHRQEKELFRHERGAVAAALNIIRKKGRRKKRRQLV